MLTLYVLRHAKAAASNAGGDFARVLADQGRFEAGQLGAFMAEQGWIASLALVSAAARTSETFKLVQSRISTKIPVRFETALYNATANQILGMLRGVAPGIVSVMLVGHNPGIAEAATALARFGDAAEIRALRDRFPPCALAVITFDVDDWRDAVASGGRLDDFVIPERLVSPR